MTNKSIELDPVPLAHDDWQYIDKHKLDEYRQKEWSFLLPQRDQYFKEQFLPQLYRMLECQKDDPAYGYRINNYYHCLLTATRMLNDGLSDEDVVVGLFHDVGFVTSNPNHGEVAASMLKPWISKRNVWMLERHGIFQNYLCHDLEGVERHERDQWRDHPYFEWTATFVEKYDQIMHNEEEIYPIEAFSPIVERFFSRKPQTIHYE